MQRLREQQASKESEKIVQLVKIKSKSHTGGQVFRSYFFFVAQQTHSTARDVREVIFALFASVILAIDSYIALSIAGDRG